MSSPTQQQIAASRRLLCAGGPQRQIFIAPTKLALLGCCIYNNRMRITFDPVKREKALAERGLDFADAEAVFEGMTLEVEDIRKEYG